MAISRSIRDLLWQIPSRAIGLAGWDGSDVQMVSVDTSGNLSTGGNVASGAADSGNPVKVGGVVSTSTPSQAANGQRKDLWMNSRGAVFLAARTFAMADGAGNDAEAWEDEGGNLRSLAVYQSLFNGTTWDRHRGNMNGTAFASAARIASANSSDVTNYNASGVHVVIDVTAATATPSVVFTIQGKDSLSGAYYTILASAAITGVSTTVLRVYPSLTAVANTVANDVLPRTWRIAAVHADADSITYSVGYSLIL